MRSEGEDRGEVKGDRGVGEVIGKGREGGQGKGEDMCEGLRVCNYKVEVQQKIGEYRDEVKMKVRDVNIDA